VNTSAEKPHLIVVGSGGQPYREYAFVTLAERYRVSAVLPCAPTWQQGYLGDATVADLTDPADLARAVSTLAGGRTDIGLLTWDETVLEVTAKAAELLGLPHMSADAAARCRDKYATRSLLAEAGLAPVRHRLVTSADEAVQAAEALGYPVVVKPRAQAASLGVIRAVDGAAVREAFAMAAACQYADLPTGHGVLVEEYLDGPEISVDSVVFDGEAECVHVARKRLAYPPYFEEVGHLVTGWSEEPWAPSVRELVAQAHRVLGVELGVTHAEVRLTSRGPRLVELNGRLGGGLIPFVSELATGIDLVVAAAELAFGRRPRLASTRSDTAEIRFVYPPYDCEVRSVDVAGAAQVPGIVHASVLVAEGSHLRLPPRDPIPRLAVLVAVGAGADDCGRALDAAEATVATDLRPLAAARAAS
jgi:biotin carboxylase